MGSVSDTPTVLDLKPLSHNPFLDGTVVYENADGVLVPRSVAGAVEPLAGNPLLDNRPSNASTQSLIDSARKTTRTGVAIDDVTLRGYRNVWGGLDTKKFGAAVDNMTDAQLDDFIHAVTDDLAASGRNAQAMRPRVSANQVLRRGSQLAGALGYAIDAYNVGSAILDPTNNPLDEIGDVAGSMIGGALGTPLGPVGVLAGSLVGGWLGRQLGNLLQGHGNRANVDTSEPPPFQGGQCPGVLYRVEVKALVNSPADRGNSQITTTYGPINGFRETHQTSTGSNGQIYYNGHVELYANGSPVEFRGWTSLYTSLAGYSAHSSQQTINYKVIDVSRTDGQPDDCGDPATPVTTGPTAPVYGPTTTPLPPGPALDDVSTSDPTGDPLPDPTGDPLHPTDDSLPDDPTGDPFGPPGGGPELDSPTVPDDLPEPRESPEPDRTVDPNQPNVKCCPETINKLDEIINLLTFTYQGIVDMRNCEGEGDVTEWQGDGLEGIYKAVKILQEQTQIIHNNTKCPTDTTAAVPMAWDIRVLEHPQLIVLWAPAEGGSSRWSMHIPYPRANLNSDYGFKFPQYKKGPVRGALILQDNSRIVVNGASEAECRKVFTYVRKLVDARRIERAQEIFTKGRAKFATRDVKAVYLKSYSGHRSQTPLWTKRL